MLAGGAVAFIVYAIAVVLRERDLSFGMTILAVVLGAFIGAFIGAWMPKTAIGIFILILSLVLYIKFFEDDD